MTRQQILSMLREHASELGAEGVAHLDLFDSAAREQMQPGSDVDVMAEFDPTQRLRLLKIGRIQQQLTEMLGVEVDLAVREWMRSPVREQAMREVVRAF